MTTFYLDLEGGNDAADGLSFANRWKTLTTGPTAARTAPGDTIRVMASPDPTSLGTCTFTQGPPPAAKNIVSSTNATPIVMTVTAHGYATGDIVRVVSHTTNTNALGIWEVGTTTANTFQLLQCNGSNTTGNGVGGATGTVTNINSLAVLLPSAVTSPIALNGGLGQKTNWTALASVTCTNLTTDYKEGYTCQQIAVAAGFTTGRAAYFATGTLDLSGYQQLTFWIKQTAGTVGAAGSIQLKLCSDTAGVTAVNTFNIPTLGGLNRWIPITVDLATNLGSSIQSVAFYVVTDNAAQTFLLDNIQAVKAASAADSLNLASLISKGSTGPWYSIQSINSNVVILGGDGNYLPTNAALRGYGPAGGSATGYKRETIKLTMLATGNAQTINEAGTAGSLIAYEFGWDRTAMTTQSGFTWVDMGNQLGSFFGNTRAFTSFNEFGGVRNATGFSNTGADVALGEIHTAGCGISNTGDRVTATKLVAVGGVGQGINTTGNMFSFDEVQAYTNTNAGWNNTGLEGRIGTMTCLNNANSGGNINPAGALYVGGGDLSNNGQAGFNLVNGTRLSAYNMTFSGNTLAAIATSSGATAVLSDCTITQATEVSAGQSSTVYSQRNDNTDNNHWQWDLGSTVNYQTTVTDSPAAGSWKMSPTSTTTKTAAFPIKLKLGTVVVGASALVTITARMRRSNTGLTVNLVCPGGQIPGVASDVSTAMTAAADTWETVTITFTPTKAGAVDIYAYASGGTTYSGYVCNLTASQA